MWMQFDQWNHEVAHVLAASLAFQFLIEWLSASRTVPMQPSVALRIESGLGRLCRSIGCETRCERLFHNP